MKHRARFSSLTSALPVLIAAGGVFAVGCETTIGEDDGGNTGGTAGVAGSASGSGGDAGTAGTSGASSGSSGANMGGTSGVGGTPGTGGTGGGTTDCVGTHVTTPKRMVRLTENQLINSYAGLFTPALAQTIATEQDIPPATFRAFPPLAVSGVLIGDTQFSMIDRMAQAGMAHVVANMATISTCGAMPTDAMCVQNFLHTFAQKAYRRPLTDAERTAINTELVAEITGATTATPAGNGGTLAQALQYGVYGILTSPGFVYRTEFGADPRVMGELSQHEIASVLSYFVTDGPPDDMLLAAAAANQLRDPAVVRMQIERMLATPAARANLEAAMVAYFQLSLVPTVVVDPMSIPGITLTAGMQAQMFREGELFMKNMLWNGSLYNLFTSTTTWTTPTLAQQIYGVPAPTQVDADMFGMVTLPADRSGMLTIAPFLIAKTRPDAPSVVGRGLALNAALLCQDNPAFPEDDPDILAGIAESEHMSQKEQADYRVMNQKCTGCHAQFDAFGLVLEPYDSIGRFRTMDLQGRTIDAAWTTSVLPDVVGGATVANVKEMAQAVIQSGALDKCMAMNLMNFALSDVSQGGAGAPAPATPTSSCAVQDVYKRFNDTTLSDKSFSALIREIAVSETISLRSAGM
ncbi:MAG TPA: DUF1592 domain-containing protein [Polyangiaceae bacterium]